MAPVCLQSASVLVVVFALLAVLAVTTLLKGGAYTSSATPSASAVVLLEGGAAPAGGQAASPATASGAASVADDSSATRALVFATPYGRGAVQKLGEWRSSLFARMAEFYKAEEDAQTNHGAGGVGRVEPQGVRRYNLFDAIVDCPRGQVQRLGPPGDGGKFVCVDGVLDKLADGTPGGQERCAIYSIGSANNYEFEEAMLQVVRRAAQRCCRPPPGVPRSSCRGCAWPPQGPAWPPLTPAPWPSLAQSTSCDVFTFDCTYDGRVLDPKRHQYHKICLGKEGKTETVNAFTTGAAAITDAQFMTYDQTTAMLKLSRVHLLKIDIEGYEFDVLSGAGLGWAGEPTLPSWRQPAPAPSRSAALGSNRRPQPS